MSTLLSFLDRIRLSLVGWVLITGAVVIAGLVAAFRIQGSRLHKAQVALLEQSAYHGVSQAQGAYEKALVAYINAGGSL